MTHKESIQLLIEENKLTSTVKVADLFKLYREAFGNDLDIEDFTAIYSNWKGGDHTNKKLNDDVAIRYPITSCLALRP